MTTLTRKQRVVRSLAKAGAWIGVGVVAGEWLQHPHMFDWLWSLF